MNRRLGWHRRGLLFGALFALAMAVSIAAVVQATTFMPDRQVAQRLSFPVSPSAFPVAAGDTIADRVLGQMDFVHATQNFATASTFDFFFARPGVAVAIDQSSVPNHVYVADFRNNRVLGWASAAALTNGKAADLVIGQPDFFSTTCNNGGVSASSLCGPVAVAVDGSGNLYVADNSNNRVLEYNTPFIKTGEPGSGDRIADEVFGQEENFTASLCNQGAGTFVMGVASSSTLCGPAGITVDSTGVLYIADQLNNRVLEFLLPSVDTTADAVFGQGGHFNTTKCDNGGISKNSLCAPVGLAADSSNNLYVADEENSRVLEYNHPPANDTTADEVFGQGVSFITALCNGGGATPTAKTLCGPTGVALDATGRLYVADERNSRVLEYATPATSATAIKVFGQGGSMTTAKCNLSGTVDANGLCRPGGLSLDTSGNLYVTDDVNNRVLRYNSAAIGNTTADVVLGQPDFAHSDPNAVDASAFGSGAGLAMAGTVDITALGTVAIDNSTGRLYVADTNNNRVLGFNNAASFANGAPRTS